MVDLSEEGRQQAIEAYRRAVARIVPTPSFASIVEAALGQTLAMELLKNASAVIVERQPGWGRHWNWYYGADDKCIELLIQDLKPGSKISFYFDGRFEKSSNAPETKEKLIRLIDEMPKPQQSLFVGRLLEDGYCIQMTELRGLQDLEDWESDNTFSSSQTLFYGDYPVDDNDGVNAVTLVLPDSDGTLRTKYRVYDREKIEYADDGTRVVPVLHLKTEEELEQWLYPKPWIEAGFLENLVPPPSLKSAEEQVPVQVSFDMGYRTTFTYLAGLETPLEFYKIKAIGVTKWCYDYDPSLYEDKTDFDDVSVEAEDGNLTLLFDRGNTLILTCAEIVIDGPHHSFERNIPDMFGRSVKIVFTGMGTLHPAWWLEQFAKAGLDVSWRRMSEGASDLSEVPNEAYGGWFLQETAKIGQTSCGLMIRGIRSCESGVEIFFETWQDSDPTLVHSLSYVAAAFPESRVSCGNCELTGPQWRAALEQGQDYLNKLFLT